MGKLSEQTVAWKVRDIKKLPAPEPSQRSVYHHPEEHRLCIIATSRSKTFYFVTRVQGRQQRIRIGTFPAWSPTAALGRAEEIAKAIDRGENPHQERRERNAAPTLRDFWRGTFGPQHVQRLKPSTAYQYRLTWRLHIEPQLGDFKLRDIDKATVRRLHADIGAAGKERTANWTLACLRCMFNVAIDTDQLAGPNPTAGAKQYKETPRDRYLTREEIARLYQSLEHDAQATADWTVHDAAKLLLLSGARKMNVLAMEWRELDLNGGRWLIPAAKTKTGRAYLVTLPFGAVEILRQRRQQAPRDAVYVFPAKRKGTRGAQHLVNIKRGWERVLALAELPGIRLHDLRHTAASLLANNGASLQIIGAQLGHASPATTARYSHLLLDTVHAAVSAATAGLGETDGGE
ncbi:MAG: tyrosine-type recombinase/integrase [Candidatus Krumholzibacteria bacterium]|nr:tyrosine-type recombinase/integrase [Candidatus Krumholzibacteria bacterium]